MILRKKVIATAVAGALAILSQAALAQYTGTTTTGPSSSATPYNQGIAGYNITSILTTGDNIGGYRMAGLPDGLGAYDNGNGTITVLMNHEIGNTLGVARAHHSDPSLPAAVAGKGAFVSEWVIDKTTLKVISGGDLIKKVYDNGVQVTTAAALSFNRFCSADLAPTTSYQFTDTAGKYGAAGTVYGTAERIFMSGEESGRGWQMAVVATGAEKGNAINLRQFNLSTNGSGLTGVGAWENSLANPTSRLQTVVIGNNDGGTGIMNNSVAVYIGTKQTTGTAVDKAGLTNGTLQFINVAGLPVERTSTAAGAVPNALPANATFTLSATASTTFSRPEDGQWSRDGKKFYFVTTDRLDTTELAGGTQKGGTRLWELDFDQIDANGDINFAAGGKIRILVDGASFADGSGKPNMFDNMTVNEDGTITLQEDTGNAAHNGKMWLYDPVTGSFKIIVRSDTARFGDVVGGVFVPGSPTLTQDEETSGIIDITTLLGRNDGQKYGLFVMQNHAAASGAFASELVEGGQLMLITAVPEPETYAMMIAGLGLLGFARRRKNNK